MNDGGPGAPDGRPKGLRSGRHAREAALPDATIPNAQRPAEREPGPAVAVPGDEVPRRPGGEIRDAAARDEGPPTDPPPSPRRERAPSAEGLAGVGSGVQRGRGNRRPVGQSIARVGLALAVAFGALAAGAGYWQVIEASPLASAADNPSVIAAARRAARGRMVDRSGTWLARNERDAAGDPYRVYRDPVLSPVLGYASRLFGSAGLERAYDAELVGLRRPDPVADMLKKFERDPYDPQGLRLSLSLGLQRAAINSLGGDRGAVVILQPQTGEVLALASSPFYDANLIANPTTSEQAFEQLRADPGEPLLPRATQGRYVPGSVFKIITAMAALESGAITPSTTFEQQPGAEAEGLRIGGFRVRDGHHLVTGEEPLDLVGATEVSCNIWYALAGVEAGGQALSDTADQLGFDGGVPFALRLADSQVTNASGQEPGGFRDVVELANAAYGQAETLVTPFQMALVAAAVANDGVLMEPRLVTSLSGKNGTRAVAAREWRRVVSGSNAASIREAMQAAVEGDLGRQFTSGAAIEGVPTGGKSGTAELGGNGEPHSWFIGFAPVDNPQVAIAVLVEQGGRGAERASPIGGELMQAALTELGSG